MFSAFLIVFLDMSQKVILYSVALKANQSIYFIFLHAFIGIAFLFIPSVNGYINDRLASFRVIKIASAISFLLILINFVLFIFGAFIPSVVLSFFLSALSPFYIVAFYKYARVLLGVGKITWANGALSANYFLAIAASSLLFKYLFDNLLFFGEIDIVDALKSSWLLGLLLIFISILQVFFAFKLEKINEFSNLSYSRKDFLSLKVLKDSLKACNKHVRLLSISLGIFFMFIQVIAINLLLKRELSFLQENLYSIFIVTLLAAIIGAFSAGRLSKSYIETGLMPFGIILILLASILLSLNSSNAVAYIGAFLIGLASSFFIVPARSLIQFHASKQAQGRVVALSYFAQGLGAIGGGIISYFIFYTNTTFSSFFVILISLIGIAIIFYKMPFSMVRTLSVLIFSQAYTIKVDGFNNIKADKGMLLLGNHISKIDWAIIQMSMPRSVYFVIERSSSSWYLKLLMDFFNIIDINDENYLQKVEKKLDEGHIVCMFPEKVISKHGHLNEFQSDYLSLNLNPQIEIIPFYICGLWGSSFSNARKNFKDKQRSFSKTLVTIAFGKALNQKVDVVALKNTIFDLSFKAWEYECKSLPTLPAGFINSAKKAKFATAIIDDNIGNISYYKLLGLSLALRGGMLKDYECVGILLPASIASSLVNLSALMAGKAVCNLNFTASKNAFYQAISLSKIKQIYTSKTFLEKLKQRGVVFEFSSSIQIIYVEDLIARLKNNKLRVLSFLLAGIILPAFLLRFLFCKAQDPQKTAAILFSSGSEGQPKGVMLSHFNMMSNIAQTIEVVAASKKDCILSSLPPFHAFGLTVTSFMPLINGICSASYPDPSDALGIAKVIAKNKVTIMCGTSTFLGIYARNPKIEPIMFESLRLVIAGAEKLKDNVRDSFSKKFHKEILEGYGVTETTPVASVNLPNEFDANTWQIHRAHKIGSVGMPLPGTSIKIVDDITLEELPSRKAGLILIGGHQVMQGYLNQDEKTNEVIVNINGIRYYKSGDKGFVDKDGFLYIIDRYSRFAKIGGEMVSLAFVEEEIYRILVNLSLQDIIKISACSIEDERKGEAIALLIEDASDNFKELIQAVKTSNINNLAKPQKYFVIDKIPILGSGKVDLKQAKALANELNRGDER